METCLQARKLKELAQIRAKSVVRHWENGEYPRALDEMHCANVELETHWAVTGRQFCGILTRMRHEAKPFASY